MSLGFTIVGDIFAHVTVFLFFFWGGGGFGLFF